MPDLFVIYVTQERETPGEQLYQEQELAVEEGVGSADSPKAVREIEGVDGEVAEHIGRGGEGKEVHSYDRQQGQGRELLEVQEGPD